MKKIFLMAALSMLSVLLVPSGGWAGQGGTPGLLFSPDAEVLEFKASSDGAETSIHWKTGLEMGVNAYRVTSEDVNGTTQTVGLVRARLGEQNEYHLEDSTVQVGEAIKYNLFMVSSYGESQVAQWEGVIEIAEKKAVPMAMAAAAATVEASIPVSERKCWIGNVDRVKAWSNAVPADRIRFSLTEEGVYKVTAQEIADAGGWDFSSVTNALANTNFAMSCQGTNIAWHPLDDGLIFYGVEPESRWAPENVYWIEFGPGQNMAHIDGPPPENGTTNQWFMDTMFVQGTDYLSRVNQYSALSAEVPVSYLSFSPGHILSGSYSQQDIEVVDCSEGEWSGKVTVNLMSAFEVGVDSHTGRVSVGSSMLGEPTWTGEQYVSFTYPLSASNIIDDVASIEVGNIAALTPIGVTDYTRFFFISTELSYARLYQTQEEFLRCTGGVNDTVAISGYASNDVVVLDVTSTNQPMVVDSAEIVFDTELGNWAASFSCGGTGRVYQVCTLSSGLRRPSLRGMHDMDWTSPEHAASYVILVPSEGWVDGFRSPMQNLADHRNAQGLKTQIVDVESIYNQFSFGLVEPQAISDFCVVGVSNWPSQPLQYLLLAGDGSLDFKHERFSVNDYTACLIPSLISGQSFSSGQAMTVMLDSAYGDIDGDQIPDIAIGRMPTPYPYELDVVVNKVLQYESILRSTDGSFSKSYAAVAPGFNGVPGAGYYDFESAVDRVVPYLQSAGRVHVPCRADPEYPNNQTQVLTEKLLPALRTGTGIFHYYGHANKISLGGSTYFEGKPGSRLLYYYDVTPNNWTSPTVAIWIGCQINVWQYLTSSPTTIVDGLFAENTGFVAGIAATGYLLTDEGEELGVHIHSALAGLDTVRLGDVHQIAVESSIRNLLNPYRLLDPERNQSIERLQSVSLIGDPALVIRHDVTAMGTDVEWLVEHGQTNANADVEDVDGDGWATWREYQDDTNPTGNVLQVVGGEMNTASGVPMIAFETTSMSSYQLEYTPSLHVSNDWTAVSWSTDGINWNPAETNIVPSGPVESIRMPASMISTQGFFRVRTVNEL